MSINVTGDRVPGGRRGRTLRSICTRLREKYHKDTVKNGRKRLICRSIDPIHGCWTLAVSHFRAFAPVASAKNEGLERVFDKILTCSFYSPRGQFCFFFDKMKTRKHAFGRSVA